MHTEQFRNWTGKTDKLQNEVKKYRKSFGGRLKIYRIKKKGGGT